MTMQKNSPFLIIHLSFVFFFNNSSRPDDMADKLLFARLRRKKEQNKQKEENPYCASQHMKIFVLSYMPVWTIAEMSFNFICMFDEAF